MRVTVRNGGGGGGRPGGAPKYNWKQNKILNIQKNEEKVRIRPFGMVEDIEKYYCEEDGDFTVDLSSIENWREPKELTQVSQNTKKQLKISFLFGTNKTSGLLPVYKKQRFSHKRVFGHKSSLTQEAN